MKTTCLSIRSVLIFCCMLGFSTAFSQTFILSGSNLVVGGSNTIDPTAAANGVFGANNLISGYGGPSLTVGSDNNVTGSSTFILGNSNYGTGTIDSAILGDLNSTAGIITAIVGSYNSIGWYGEDCYGANSSVIIGEFNSLFAGAACFVVGRNNDLDISSNYDPFCSVALGQGLLVTTPNHIAVGRYNKNYQGGSLPSFTVGTGTSSRAPFNALEVRQDNSTTINGKLFVNDVTSFNGSVSVVGSFSINGGSVLTQSSGDLRYLSSSAGLSVSSGNVSISGTGSFTLPDGTVLSAGHSIQTVVASSTASSISGSVSAGQVTGLSEVATTGNYQSLTGRPTIPTDTNQLTNGAQFISASGTASNLAVSGTTIFAGQTSISGSTTVNGGIVVTGTLDNSTNTIVAADSNRLVIIPQQGDLSMGDFTNGKKPIQ